MLESCCRSAGAIRKCGRRSRNGRRSRQKPWRSVRTGRRGRAEYRSDWARPSGAIRETFDAVTHALLRTPLTDGSGQKFGDGLSLIERVHTVKGEVSGARAIASSDVCPIDAGRAREMLNRSREFNPERHAGRRADHSTRPSAPIPRIWRRTVQKLCGVGRLQPRKIRHRLAQQDQLIAFVQRSRFLANRVEHHCFTAIEPDEKARPHIRAIGKE